MELPQNFLHEKRACGDDVVEPLLVIVWQGRVHSGLNKGTHFLDERAQASGNDPFDGRVVGVDLLQHAFVTTEADTAPSKAEAEGFERLTLDQRGEVIGGVRAFGHSDGTGHAQARRGGVTDHEYVRVRDGAQILIDDNLTDAIDGESGLARQRRHAERTRPDDEIGIIVLTVGSLDAVGGDPLNRYALVDGNMAALERV